MKAVVCFHNLLLKEVQTGDKKTSRIDQKCGKGSAKINFLFCLLFFHFFALIAVDRRTNAVNNNGINNVLLAQSPETYSEGSPTASFMHSSLIGGSCEVSINRGCDSNTSSKPTAKWIRRWHSKALGSTHEKDCILYDCAVKRE